MREPEYFPTDCYDETLACSEPAQGKLRLMSRAERRRMLKGRGELRKTKRVRLRPRT